MQRIEIQYCERYLLKDITFCSISRLQVFFTFHFFTFCVFPCASVCFRGHSKCGFNETRESGSGILSRINADPG